MKMKKSGLLLASLLSLILASTFAAAQVELPTPSPGEVATGFIKFITGDLSSLGLGLQPWILSKFLLIILLTVVLSKPAKQLVGEDREGIAFLVSALVAILGTNFLATEQIVTAVLLPYGAFAVAMSVMIPLVLAFYFIEDLNHSVLRRIGWSVMFTGYIGLYWLRLGDLGWGPLWIYLGGALISLALIVMDGTVNYWKIQFKARQGQELDSREKFAEIMYEIYNTNDKLLRAHTDEERKIWKEKLAELEKKQKEFAKKAAGRH